MATNSVTAGAVSAETPTDVVKLRQLKWSIAFQGSNNVFVQLTFWGAPFVLFLNELRLSNAQIGFLFSLIPFCGLVALFIAPWIARNGYKRTYLTFYTGRKFLTALLLFVPYIHTRFDGRWTLLYVTLVMGFFSLSRAVAETAIFPWMQEYIPNSVRGKHSATAMIVSRILGISAVVLAGYIVDSSTDLNRFTLLFAIAVGFGLLGAMFATQIPGGKAINSAETQMGLRETLGAVKDKNFRMYLLGLGAITFAATPQSAFVPLFMRREIGLIESQVVWLQTGVLIGGLLSTYFWGWAADRYGSKPIILSGLYLRIVLTVGWLVMPRSIEGVFYIAFGLALLQGITVMGWMIGAGRLLFVRVVPTEHKAQYMAVYYAVLGLFGGFSQLIGGNLIDYTAGLRGDFLIFKLDPFTPLFVGSLALTLMGIALFNRVSADNDFTVGQFVGMFMRGNSLSALTSVMRYYRASDEIKSIAATEHLGNTKSPIAVDELLDALRDPRFNVRFEAIIAMARMRPDPRVIEALEKIVMGSELALTTPAIWALGRIRSPEAISTLRGSLDADYRSIRASSARALGSLQDKESAVILLERLQSEKNPGLNMAYASALGNLTYEPAIETIVQLLDSAENTGARLELALSLARIVGKEGHFIQLLRKERADMGTSSAQALIPLRKQYGEQHALRPLLDASIDAFAAQSLDDGAIQLGHLLQQLPPESVPEIYTPILHSAATRLSAEGTTRPEFIVLAVHLLVVINSK